MTVELPGQFVLSESRREVPPGWRWRSIAGTELATAPLLPVSPVTHPAVGACAWLIGDAIYEGALLTEAGIGLGDGESGPLDAVLDLLSDLGGRYVAIVNAEGRRRLYPDAGATRSLTYAPDERAAASGPAALFPTTYGERYDSAFAAAVGMPDEDHWYPAGLTPHFGVHRLLPNHYLDLDSWSVTRSWPESPPPPCTGAEAVPQVAALVGESLSAAGADGGGALSLTAGQDSRALLACSRRTLQDATFFCFLTEEDSVDAHMARRLAQGAGLELRELPVREATADQTSDWLRRTGHAVSGAIRRIHPTLALLESSRIVLPGMAGEVARAYYWKPRDVPSLRITANELVERMHLPAHPRFVEATARWLGPLEGYPLPLMLDLAYIEHRLGCWSGPQAYGSDPYGRTLIPLARRAIFELMLGLPERYRREERLAPDLCRLLWPELLDLPFNRYTGLRRHRHAVEMSLRRARRAPRKLARITGMAR